MYPRDGGGVKISVVVTTYNRPDALVQVLDSLDHQTQPPDEVLVADDGSETQTAAAIDGLSRQVTYPLLHVWHEDRGFRAAKIRNDAIRNASGEYIVLLDGDCIPDGHFVNDHRRLARSGHFFQGKRVLVSQRASAVFKWQETRSARRLIWLAFSRQLDNVHHLIRCPWLSPFPSSGIGGTRSCNLGVFRSDLFAVNGFNEDFSGWGREDSELVARLYNYGLKRNVHPFSAICFHLWHEENSRDRLSDNDEILRKTLASDEYYTRQGLAKGA